MQPTEPDRRTSKDAESTLRDRIVNDCILPVSPILLVQLVQMGKDPDTSPQNYADVIATSDFLAAKVLGAVNSAWWGLRQPVRSVPQAVTLLGTASTRMIAIAHCMASLHKHVRLPKAILDSYWSTSLTKAMAASLYVEQTEGGCTGEAFVSAIMQDMAMPVMHEICPDPYARTERGVSVASAQLCIEEREIFGMDHCDAASLLARSVGLPEFMSDCLEQHHSRRALGERSRSIDLANALYLAALFPHIGLPWHQDDMGEAAALIHRTFDSTWSLAAVVETVRKRCDDTMRIVSQAKKPKGTLRSLLAKGSAALAKATVETVVDLRSTKAAQEKGDNDQATDQADVAVLDTSAAEAAQAEAPTTGRLQRKAAAFVQAFRESNSSVAVLLAEVDVLPAPSEGPESTSVDAAVECVQHMLQVTLGRTAMVAPCAGRRLLVIVGGFSDAKHLEWTTSRLCEQLASRPVALASGTIRVSLTIGGQWYQAIPATVDMAELTARAEAVMDRVRSYGKGFAAVEDGAADPHQKPE